MAVFDLKSWGEFRDHLTKDYPDVISHSGIYNVFITCDMATNRYLVGLQSNCIPSSLRKLPVKEINHAFNDALGEYANYVVEKKASNIRLNESLNYLVNTQFNGIVLGDAILSKLVMDNYPELVV